MAATKGTIALFGATGNTGKHFLPAALEAGFTVKALVRNPAKVSIENAALTLVKGDLSSEEDIGSLIQGADIVVCLANVPRGTKKGSTMDGWMTRVMTTIVEQMKRHSVKRLLFQCGAFTRLDAFDGVRRRRLFERALNFRDAVRGRVLLLALAVRLAHAEDELHSAAAYEHQDSPGDGEEQAEWERL